MIIKYIILCFLLIFTQNAFAQIEYKIKRPGKRYYNFGFVSYSSIFNITNNSISIGAIWESNRNLKNYQKLSIYNINFITSSIQLKEIDFPNAINHISSSYEKFIFFNLDNSGNTYIIYRDNDEYIRYTKYNVGFSKIFSKKLNLNYYNLDGSLSFSNNYYPFHIDESGKLLIYDTFQKLTIVNANGIVINSKKIIYNDTAARWIRNPLLSGQILKNGNTIFLSYVPPYSSNSHYTIVLDTNLNIKGKFKIDSSTIMGSNPYLVESLFNKKYYTLYNNSYGFDAKNMSLIDTGLLKAYKLYYYPDENVIFEIGDYHQIIERNGKTIYMMISGDKIKLAYLTQNLTVDSAKMFIFNNEKIPKGLNSRPVMKNNDLIFTYTNYIDSSFRIVKVPFDSLGKYFAEFELCEKLHIDTLQITRNDDITLIDQPIVQFPNAVVTENITNPTFTYTHYPINTKGQSSCHSAHFTLPKDTFCINEVLNLYSDTCVKQGNSYWKIRYATDSQESWDYKFENIALLQKGVAYISHTHELAGCVQSHFDTIFIQDSSGIASLDLGKDTTFCGSSVSLKLDAYNANFSSYLWNTGSHDSAIIAVGAGTYWVRATSACGTLSDTLHITESQAPSLSIFAQDTLALCPLQFPYTLYTGIITNDAKDFLWNTGSTMPFIEVNNTGKYWVSVKSGCHIWNDTVFVKQKDTLPLPSYPDSFKLCKTALSLIAPQGLFLEVYRNNNWQSFPSFPLTTTGKITYRWRDSCNRIWQKNIVIWNDTIPLLFPKNMFVYCDPIFQKNPEIQNTNPLYKIEKWQNNQWNLASSYTMNVGNTIFKTSDTCGNYRLDTVVGIYKRQTLVFFNIDSIVLCPSQLPYRIAIVDTFKNYRWQYWDEPNYYMATVEGMHYVDATDSCYIYSDSVYVRLDTPQNINLNLPYNLSFCADTISHTVSALGGFGEYIWNRQKSNQSTYSFRYPLSVLYLQVPRTCDTLHDTTKIAWTLPDTTSPKIKIDSTQCESMAGIQLSLLNASAFKRYVWQNGATEPTIFVNQKDSISLTTNNTCFDNTWRFVGKYCQPFPIGLPSAFSPNGDNKNDVFKINGNLLGITIVEMKIFNRWGECVYAVYYNFPNWDGTYKNTPQSVGTYIYYMRYSYVSSPQIVEIKGSLNLMR